MGIMDSLNISKLTAQENGGFAILVNGKVFGEISAHPKASFNIVGGQSFSEGTYNYKYEGTALNIVVKDLKLRFAPVDDDYYSFVNARKLNIPKEDHIRNLKDANKKAEEEVLARVVVTKA